MTAPSPARQWQELSLLDLASATQEAFMGVIESIPSGRRFTVNDLRDRLDAANIPASARGGLFARASRLGLIEPVRITAWGVTADVYVASTGDTAHAATVRVYRRRGAAAAAEAEGVA